MHQRQRKESSIPIQTRFSSATPPNVLIKQLDPETLGDISKQSILELINTAPIAITPPRVQHPSKSI